MLANKQYQVAEKMSQTFACVIQWSSLDESAEKHLCNEQNVFEYV